MEFLHKTEQRSQAGAFPIGVLFVFPHIFLCRRGGCLWLLNKNFKKNAKF